MFKINLHKILGKVSGKTQKKQLSLCRLSQDNKFLILKQRIQTVVHLSLKEAVFEVVGILLH